MIRLHSDQNRLPELLRQSLGQMPPFDRQQVVGLIENNPMWARGTGSEHSKARKELTEEDWPICELNPEEIDIQVNLRILENGKHFVDAHRMIPIAQSDHSLRRPVIALGIDNADLIVLRYEALHETGDDGGFAAARGSGYQDIYAIRRNRYRDAIRTQSNSDEVLLEFALYSCQVIPINSSISSATPSPACCCVTKAASR